MKRINKKSLLLLAVIIAGSLSVQAQEFKNDRSVSNQIKNNNIPGAVYAPAASAKQSPAKGYAGSSFLKQIQEGKLGMPVKTGANAPATQSATVAKTTQVTLPSEQSSTEAKAKADAEAKAKPVSKQPVITQEEKSKEGKPVVENKQ